MAYTEPSNEFDDDVEQPEDLNDIDEGESEELNDEFADETEEDSEKHPLEVRRAIEDHLERSRMQKEFDYLFDEGSIEENLGDEDQK